MESARYLLDMSVIAELTRPTGNRRVFTLFSRHHTACVLAAPVVYALMRGVESLPDGARRTQLRGFVDELLRSGPPVLPFDSDAAQWLARESLRRRRYRPWTMLEGQLAAIAATRELVLVTRTPASFAGVMGLRLEDWFRP